MILRTGQAGEMSSFGIAPWSARVDATASGIFRVSQ